MSKVKINTNSTINQRIKGDFVAREVKTCFSYEMDAILKASSMLNVRELDLPCYEEIENLYIPTCSNCGEQYHGCENTINECPKCKTNSIESEAQDILEWWIVTEFLYKDLKEQSEPVLEWGNNYYWGRTCSGQSILLDSVISTICQKMEILDGQKYSCAKKG